MFWKLSSAGVSQIEKILAKPDFTLKEVLEQEDVIQECKSQNKKLIDFLTQNEVLSELLDLILSEPEEGLAEKTRFKLPNIASELITCDISQINEKLSSDVALLDKMYNFLDTEASLNPLLTSFFSKVFGVLITRRAEQNWYSYQFTCLQVINYIKSKPGFVPLLLRHVHTSAVMDLLLRLITCVEGVELKENVLDWLNGEQLIEKVIDLFAAEKPPAPPEGADLSEKEEADDTKIQERLFTERDCHDNAGQLLVEIIRVSRDSQITAAPSERFRNPLLDTAESVQTVQRLLNVMLTGPPRESVIVNCISVLHALLEIRKPAPQGPAGLYRTTNDQENLPNQADIDRQQEVMERTVECIIPRLLEIQEVLSQPPAKPPVHTTAGILDPPLGASRLAVCKLVASLLATQLAGVNPALAATDTLNLLLDLFFQYSLNNFLHAQVESCLKSIICWRKKTDVNTTAVISERAEDETLQTPKVQLDPENPLESKGESGDEAAAENPLLIKLLLDTRLIERMVGAWDTEDKRRLGYFGHLLRICNHVTEAVEEKEGQEANHNRLLIIQLLAQLTEEVRSKWEALAAGRLKEENKKCEITAPDDRRRNNSSDDDSDFRDIQFPQDTALQQMFSDYQMQQMSENFIDTFGFNDEEFNESEEDVSKGIRKLTPNVNFLMASDEAAKQNFLDSVCKQRIDAFRSSPVPDEEEDEDPWEDKTAEITFGGQAVPELTKAKVEPGGGEQDEDEDSSDEETKDHLMEVDQDQDPMDTSSPWDGDGAEAGGAGWADFSTASQEEAHGGDGWADFGSMSEAPQVAAGDDGGGFVADFDGLSGEARAGSGNGDNGSVDSGSQVVWQPVRSSSPEATMLDQYQSPGKLSPSAGPGNKSLQPGAGPVIEVVRLDMDSMDSREDAAPAHENAEMAVELLSCAAAAVKEPEPSCPLAAPSEEPEPSQDASAVLDQKRPEKEEEPSNPPQSGENVAIKRETTAGPT